MPEIYDVFISYKSDYKPWVETLARNLEAQGLSVWFDDWRKVAGDRVTVTLEVGIRQARAGILIVTPEAAESGWVQKEYDTMVSEEHRRRPDGSRFRVIPVLLRPTDGFPFLQGRFAVDFRDPSAYERRLIELVRGLRGQPAPPDARLDAPAEPPPVLPNAATIDEGRARSLFDSIFDSADIYGIVALFVQESMGLGAHDLLADHARRRYAHGTVLSIVPLICGDQEADSYFADISRQFGIPDTARTAGQLGARLSPLVQSGRPLVLLVNSFENGPLQARHELASQLRNFRSTHPEVRLIIRGGEQLARLKYEHGDLSLLNIAITWYWPELNYSDLQRLHKEVLSDEVANAVLSLTGGEPRMVAHCLRRLSEIGSADVSTDIGSFNSIAAELLTDCDLGAQIFVPLRKESASLPKLIAWLGKPQICPFTGPHLDNVLLRRLFWRNALRIGQDGQKRSLMWRSEHLRRIGNEILQCEGA